MNSLLPMDVRNTLLLLALEGNLPRRPATPVYATCCDPTTELEFMLKKHQ